MSHCCHAALHTVLLPPYCLSTVMLLCNHHTASPVSHCSDFFLHAFCFRDAVHSLPLSCCFASVMLHCLCHVLASVMLLCLCHAALPLSCCSASISCLCHSVLPLSCFFACHVSYCSAPVNLLQQHPCVSHVWLA